MVVQAQWDETLWGSAEWGPVSSTYCNATAMATPSVVLQIKKPAVIVKVINPSINPQNLLLVQSSCKAPALNTFIWNETDWNTATWS
jgi:hypothetical protein